MFLPAYGPCFMYNTQLAAERLAVSDEWKACVDIVADPSLPTIQCSGASAQRDSCPPCYSLIDAMPMACRRSCGVVSSGAIPVCAVGIVFLELRCFVVRRAAGADASVEVRAGSGLCFLITAQQH